MEEKPPDNVVHLPVRAIKDLGLQPEVEQLVIEMQSALIDAYNKSLVHLASTVKDQASALVAIQETLRVIVQNMNLGPELEKKLPAVMRLASPGEDPSLPIIIADPNKVGYSLSQVELAQALGLKAPDVSVLVRAFQLDQDAACSVVVRSGKNKHMVNYHPRTADRFRELLKNPPSGLTADQKSTAKRVLAKLAKKS